MQARYGLNPPPKSQGPLRKLAGLIVTAALVGLVLMFSAVLLAVIAVIGTMAWAYLWWKSRELRRRMRDFPSQPQRAADDDVYEGEVIRVVDSRQRR